VEGLLLGAESRYEKQQVCKLALVRFCPNNFFVNTKSDLGMFFCNPLTR